MLTQDWEKVRKRDLTRRSQRDSRSGLSQTVSNFITTGIRMIGRPKKFDGKLSLVKREQNILYAEDKRRNMETERITN
jgi:hypothetical protein